MPPDDGLTYDFRPVTKKDMPQLAAWLAEPHIIQWWEAPQIELAAISEHMDSISVEPLIIELDGKPIGYLQSYDPHLEDDHPYSNQPFGTVGIDQFIGPPQLLGLGHGTRLIRQFCDELFAEGAIRVITDPHLANLRAIRAYEKAGFSLVEQRQSKYGPALLMARDGEDGDVQA